MKKTLTYLFALGLLVITSSCADNAADEIFDLKKTDKATATVGDKSPDTEDNLPPAQ